MRELLVEGYQAVLIQVEGFQAVMPQVNDMARGWQSVVGNRLRQLGDG